MFSSPLSKIFISPYCYTGWGAYNAVISAISSSITTIGLEVQEKGCSIDPAQSICPISSSITSEAIAAGIGIGFSLLPICLILVCDNSDDSRKEAIISLISSVMASGVSVITEPYVGWGATVVGTAAGYSVSRLLSLLSGYCCKSSPEAAPLIINEGAVAQDGGHPAPAPAPAPGYGAV
jgi:hypothetical protein